MLVGEIQNAERDMTERYVQIRLEMKRWALEKIEQYVLGKAHFDAATDMPPTACELRRTTAPASAFWARPKWVRFFVESAIAGGDLEVTLPRNHIHQGIIIWWYLEARMGQKKTGAPGRRYTKEFKIEAVRLGQSVGYTAGLLIELGQLTSRI
jgi:hypothetical protein